ncbi:P-loop_containing nucleoside triphosphate hydrolase [Hexamita inflata]|uniref:P-loop containing nucleoside triphosphate hydrolase n=1 Tax=Hexamita inflata TaxID=28002 RepID=A0AA86URZ4_9EUKA|nr:P-loop containing nucleoside triphosphate hydrolase [Hexamita inflata]
MSSISLFSSSSDDDEPIIEEQLLQNQQEHIVKESKKTISFYSKIFNYSLDPSIQQLVFEQRTNIVVLYGLHGSGKTTLVQNLIHVKPDSNTYSYLYEHQRGSNIVPTTYLCMRKRPETYILQMLEVTDMNNPLIIQVMKNSRNRLIQVIDVTQPLPQQQSQLLCFTKIDLIPDPLSIILTFHFDQCLIGPFFVERKDLQRYFSQKRPQGAEFESIFFNQYQFNIQPTNSNENQNNNYLLQQKSDYMYKYQADLFQNEKVQLFGQTTVQISGANLITLQPVNLNHVIESDFNILKYPYYINIDPSDDILRLAHLFNLYYKNKHLYLQNLEQLNFICRFLLTPIPPQINYLRSCYFRSKNISVSKQQTCSFSAIVERNDTTLTPFENQFCLGTFQSNSLLVYQNDDELNEIIPDIQLNQIYSEFVKQCDLLNLYQVKLILFDVIGQTTGLNLHNILLDALNQAQQVIVEPVQIIHVKTYSHDYQEKLIQFTAQMRAQLVQIAENELKITVPLLECPNAEYELFQLFDNEVTFAASKMEWKVIEYNQMKMDPEELCRIPAKQVEIGYLGQYIDVMEMIRDIQSE